jgi:hypothetical protein
VLLKVADLIEEHAEETGSVVVPRSRSTVVGQRGGRRRPFALNAWRSKGVIDNKTFTVRMDNILSVWFAHGLTDA